MKGKILKYIFIIAISFLMPIVLFAGINTLLFYENEFFLDNKIICGVNIYGLTKQEAEKKIINEIENSKNISLKLIYNHKQWLFNEQDFDLDTNIHTVLDNLYKTNRKGGYFQKLRTSKKIVKMGFSNEVAVNYILLGMNEKIDNILKEIEKEPVNANINYNKITRSFDITKENIGLKVNKENLYKDIINKINLSNDVKIEIIPEKVYPTITEENLLKHNKKQSSFSTNYANSNPARKNNIKIATETLNGYKINAGETFSFNEVLGKRLKSKGYQEANIIQDGSFVKGIGGGICQVSTTLYNALILSGIKVTEVHKHSLPVSYVKPGLDAMVSWNSADLKFKNTTNYPIFILSKCDGNNINFYIYGNTKKEDITIKLESEIVQVIPPGQDKIIPDNTGKYADKIMFKGEFVREKHGKDGYKTKTYLLVFENNTLISRELIRECKYEPQQGILYEGTDILPEGMTLPSTQQKNLAIS